MATMFMVLGLSIIVMVARSDGSTGVSCEKQESCYSKINKSSLLMNCGCDKSCVAIGDCCSDYRYNEKEKVSLPTKPECIHMPLIERATTNSVAMVLKCPVDYPDLRLKKRCETLQDNLPITVSKLVSDFPFYVPVIGKTSQVLFANIFCATCNGEESTFLDVDLRTRRPISLKNTIHTRDIASLNSVFPRTQVLMSKKEFTPRPCRTALSQCHESWPQDVDSLLCRERSASYVYDRINLTVYKNKYCAKCNYVGEENTTCSDPRIFLSNAHGIALFPYSMLFDLNTGAVVSRHQRSPKVMEITTIHQKEIECPSAEVYDPFHRECVDILCQDKYAKCKYLKKEGAMKEKDLEGQDKLNFWRRMIESLFD